MEPSADVVVVGAGMAGLEAALELRAAGVGRVVVVDGSTGSLPAPRLSTGGALPVSATHRGLGGRSRAWHGVTIRLEDWALDEWPASVSAALRERWYDVVERDLHAWAGAPLGAARERDDELRRQLTGSTEVQWQLVPRAVRQDGDDWRAYTPLDRWEVDPTNTLVLPGSAVEVVLDGDRIAGVRVEPGGDVVPAGQVLLAAGALEATRLVAQLHGQADQSHPFVDHLVQGFVVRLPARALAAPGFARWPADEHSRCSVFARTQRVDDGIILDVWTMGEQLAESASRVGHPDADRPPWPVVIDPRIGPADEAVLDTGRARMKQVWTAIGSGAGLHWPPFQGDEHRFEQAFAASGNGPLGQPFAYTWPLGSVHHEGSTLALGVSVDEAGRVPGVDGLWVTGPAVFGRQGTANPSLTTLALARRTAHLVAQS